MPKSKEFKELMKNVSKEYLGKPVPLKYQGRYGKVYDKKEVKSVAYAIGNKKHLRI